MEPNQPQPKKGLSTGCIVGIILGVIGLLVVGGIIVTAAVMFPVANKVQEKALIASAASDAHNLKSAIAAYYTEYRRHPVAKSEDGADTTLISDSTLMDVLLAADSAVGPGGLNPRGIAFFVGKQAKPAGDGKYKQGVSLGSGGSGELWDPFGNRYQVLLDTNYDNSLDSPEPTSITIPRNIAVWSAGPDGDFDTWEDNIKTW